MRKACSLILGGFVVSHVAGSHGERVDIVELRKWCSADTNQVKVGTINGARVES
jgi:hypothetical protein